MKNYSNVEPFRFWCQKVLPLVYDESLSYYELLCKVVSYVNNLISDVTAVESNVSELTTSFEELKEYCENYLKNLDVQSEINTKLDIMAEDGTLDTIINNNIFDELNAKIDTTQESVATVEASTLKYENGVTNANGMSITAYKLERYGNATLLSWKGSTGKKYYGLVDGGWDTTEGNPFCPPSDVYPDPNPTATNDALTVYNAIAKVTKHIDYIFVTHYHYDHLGAIYYLAENGMLDNNTVLVIPTLTPDAVPEKNGDTTWNNKRTVAITMCNNLNELANNHNVRIYNTTKPDFDNLRFIKLEFATPPYIYEGASWEPNNFSDFDDYYNNWSVIYQFTPYIYPGVWGYTYTEPGDIEFVGQFYWQYDAYPSEIIKTPHHSFDKEASWRFYKAVNPKYAITQNAKNRFDSIWDSGYSVLYSENNVTEFRTGLQTFTIDITKKGVRYLTPAQQAIYPHCHVKPNLSCFLGTNQTIPKNTDPRSNLIKWGDIRQSYFTYQKWGYNNGVFTCGESGTYLITISLRIEPESTSAPASWYSSLIVEGTSAYSAAAQRAYYQGNAYLNYCYEIALKEGEKISVGLECDTVAGTLKANNLLTYLRIVRL